MREQLHQLVIDLSVEYFTDFENVLADISKDVSNRVSSFPEGERGQLLSTILMSGLAFCVAKILTPVPREACEGWALDFLRQVDDILLESRSFYRIWRDTQEEDESETL